MIHSIFRFIPLTSFSLASVWCLCYSLPELSEVAALNSSTTLLSTVAGYHPKSHMKGGTFVNIDTEELRRAVYEFQFYSRPSSATGSDPATVKDINNVINNVAKLLNTFIQELEQAE